MARTTTPPRNPAIARATSAGGKAAGERAVGAASAGTGAAATPAAGAGFDTSKLIEKSRQPALGKHADRTLGTLVRQLQGASDAAKGGDDAALAKDLAAALRRNDPWDV